MISPATATMTIRDEPDRPRKTEAIRVCSRLGAEERRSHDTIVPPPKNPLNAWKTTPPHDGWLEKAQRLQ